MLTDKPISPSLPVVDMARAREFYEQKLGLKAAHHPMPGLAVYLLGDDTRLILYKRSQTTADHTVASFAVSDIETEVQELKSKGVEFEDYDTPDIKTSNGIAEKDGVKAAWFKDSEGNILGLTQG